MKAIVIGATGATGKPLVDALLKDDTYDSVVIFVRKETILRNDKLTEYVTDFSDIEKFADVINGDVLFSCIGTTLKNAGSKDAQWQVDYEIPLKMAAIAKNNGVHTCVLVSSSNADANSSFFYAKMKGALENKIRELHFDRFIIFRPGMLDRPNSNRLAECMVVAGLKIMNRMGLMRKYKPLPTSLLADKMIKSVNAFTDVEASVNLNEIFSF